MAYSWCQCHVNISLQHVSGVIVTIAWFFFPLVTSFLSNSKRASGLASKSFLFKPHGYIRT
jgi:hypothetical protein